MDFFCIFARNCVNGKSRRDHRLLMGKLDKGFKQIRILRGENQNHGIYTKYI